MRVSGWVVAASWTLCVLATLFVLPGSASATPVSEVDRDIARGHFQRGRESYQRGELAEALVEFEAARRVLPLPELDFNIGRCHDRLEHLPEAIAAYQRYVNAAPTAQDAEEIRVRIQTLRVRDEQSRPAASLALRALPPPPVPVTKKAWFWVTIVGAAGVIAAGVTLGILYGKPAQDPSPTMGTVQAN